MSLMSMRRKMASRQTATIILWVLIVIFLVSAIFMSLPGNFLNPPKSSGAADNYTGANGNVVLAKVNGSEITVADYNGAYNAQVSQDKRATSLDSALQVRSTLFADIIRARLAEQALKSFNIRNLDRALREYAEDYAQTSYSGMLAQAQMQAQMMKEQAKTPEEKKKLKSADELMGQQIAQFFSQISLQGNVALNEANYKRVFVNNYLLDAKQSIAAQFREHVQTRLIGDAIMKKDMGGNPLTEELLKKLNTQEVKASEIFIEDKTHSAKGLEAAKAKAITLHDAIKAAPETFAAVAKKESSDPAASKGGDLGWIKGGDASNNLPITLEYLIFSGKENSLSPVIQVAKENRSMPTLSHYGYAFVQINGIRDRADKKNSKWAQERDQFSKETRQRYELEFGSEYLAIQNINAKIECNSAELATYLDEMRGDFVKADRDRAKAFTEQNIPPAVKAALGYRLAQNTKDHKARIDLLVPALQYAPPATASGLYVDMAQSYAVLGNKKEAIVQLNNAKNYALDDAGMLTVIRDEFRKIGAKEEADSVSQRIDELKAKTSEGSAVFSR